MLFTLGRDRRGLETGKVEKLQKTAFAALPNAFRISDRRTILSGAMLRPAVSQRYFTRLEEAPLRGSESIMMCLLL